MSSLLRNSLNKERTNIFVILYDENSFDRSISCTFWLLVRIRHRYAPKYFVYDQIIPPRDTYAREKKFQRRFASVVKLISGRSVELFQTFQDPVNLVECVIVGHAKPQCPTSFFKTKTIHDT